LASEGIVGERFVKLRKPTPNEMTLSGADDIVSTATGWKPYADIARIDHWFKQMFLLPGTLLAIVLAEIPIDEAIIPTIAALLSASLIASANYTINEYLDAQFDRHHPTKKHRPSAVGNVKLPLVIVQYIVLAAAGLYVASMLPAVFLGMCVLFLALGAAYNIPPVRTKDIPYLDVLWESLNNPLRLLLGWSALVASQLPPSSIMLAYWMGGAFLMSVKRYSEYESIGDPETAALYRKTYRYYTTERLLLSTFFFALSSVFFLGIFLVKYRIEFLLSFPFFALLFVWYLAIGMKPDSNAQKPEKLYLEWPFLLYLVFLGALVTLLFFIDIPSLHIFVESVDFR
jgi:decaprenyl-phosphate phosphoribosyltransferase